MEAFRTILMFLLTTCLTLSKASNVTTSNFERVAVNVSVSSYLAVTSELSRIGCMTSCGRYPSCNACAFDSVLGRCLLLSNVPDSIGGGQGQFTVYRRQNSVSAPVCQESEVLNLLPSNIDPAVTWHRTLTSVVGEADCDYDYVYSLNSTPVVRCLATGEWEIENGGGTCNQRIYNLPDSFYMYWYLFPRTPRPGWKVCVTGYPTQHYRFTIDFMNETDGVMLHFDNRLDYYGDINMTVLDSCANDRDWFEVRQVLTPANYPFSVDRVFYVNFTAVDMYTFQIDVNGEHYATYGDTPAPIDGVGWLSIVDDVTITEINLWCDKSV